MRIRDNCKSFIAKGICQIEVRSGYGFEKDNPIVVPIMHAMDDVLCGLQVKGTRGGVIDYDRASERSKNFQGPVDHFEVLYRYVSAGSFRFKIYDIYFCCYPRVGEKRDFVQFCLGFSADIKEIELPKEFEWRR